MRFSSATTWRELISLSNFCHSFSTRTVRTIRTGRVDTEEAFGRRAVKWIGPALLLKGDLDFSTLLPDDAAHPVAAIG